VLRKISGPKRERMTGQRKLHSESFIICTLCHILSRWPNKGG